MKVQVSHPRRAHQARLRNRLPELLRSKGLSEKEVEERVAGVLGRRLDRRTLRRYLRGDAIQDPTMTTIAALCQAIGVTLSDALEWQPWTVAEALKRAGIRIVPWPEEWGPAEPLSEPDPSWMDVVEPFLEERRRGL